VNDCIFCKIAKGEAKAEKVYEDGSIIIIKDIFPKARIHYLLIPKEHYASMFDLNEKRAGVLAAGLVKLKTLAPALGLSGGYRIVCNSGPDAFQTVMHLHMHILGGEKLGEDFGSAAFSRAKNV
jgi:histidine triad (HIT) family protein